MPFLSRWFFIRRYDEWDAKRNGKADGAIGIPRQGATKNPPYIDDELAKVANGCITSVAQAWMKRYTSIQDRLTSDLADLDSAKQQRATAEQELEQERDQYATVYGRRPGAFIQSPWPGYWTLMILLFVFELPLNALVFRALNESEALTIIFTCALAFVLLFGADLLGKLLKEQTLGSEENSFLKITRWVFITLCILLPLIVTTGVAYYRHKYIQDNAPPGESVGEGIDVVTIFFFAVNVFFYVIATIASYRVHNERRDELLRAQRRFKHAEATLASTQKNVDRLTALRQSTFRLYNLRAQQVKDSAYRLIGVYRKFNDRARKEAIQWPDYSEMNLPEELLTPPWQDGDGWNTALPTSPAGREMQR